MTTSAVGERNDLPDRNPAHWHPLVQTRWPLLRARLLADGFDLFVNEGYRPEQRQQWLYGQGRSIAECQSHGIAPAFARMGPRVTNAWSASVSAHGVTIFDDSQHLVPASAALDVVPMGGDGKPWTSDDPWSAWLATLARYGASVGLIHFTSHGIITDQPHLELVEWCNRCHVLHLNGARCPLAPSGGLV